MESFFSRLTGQSRARRSDRNYSKSTCSPSTAVSFPEEKDLEVDGFVFIGQTESNTRENIGTKELDQQECRVSPSVLNSYKPDITQQSTALQSPSPYYNTMSKPVCPVSGVPFKFHPLVDIQSHVSELFTGVDLEVRSFNWAKYSHDFSNEKLCLRDLSCGEDANIDDFVSAPGDSNYLNSTTSQQENLITLN